MTFCRAAGFIVSTYLVLAPRPGAAQTPETLDRTSTPQQNAEAAPLRHLAEAERLLNGIRTPDSLKKGDKKKFAQLRDNFAKLVNGYRGNPDGFVPPTVVQEADLKPGKDATPVNWKMNFADVENDLASILGGGSSLPPSTPAGAGTAVGGVAAPVSTTGSGSAVVSGTPPVGTSGTASVDTANASGTNSVADPAAPGTTPSGTGPAAAGAPPGVAADTSSTATQGIQGGGFVAVVGEIGIKDLEPGVRRQLEQFRLEAELFFATTTMNLEHEAGR